MEQDPKRQKMRRAGIFMVVAGLLFAAVSLLPKFGNETAFPWPIFAGSAIYLPGAFLIFASTKGEDRRKAMITLRFVRLAFAAILLIVVLRMFPLA